MPAVTSSAIDWIDYDRRKRVLTIAFRETTTYNYFDVPPDVYRAFLASDSKGRFFNFRIRDRYAYSEAGQRGGPRQTSRRRPSLTRPGSRSRPRRGAE
ncbi:KTSC domain-containing protein [Chelatococcus sp. GCM10030263]|uniref:KTSC domain-containing protein n=1 Tax=Chelatococcus sp. GCM10030263 TaxID=3273387 RepID=UPI003620BB0E